MAAAGGNGSNGNNNNQSERPWHVNPPLRDEDVVWNESYFPSYLQNPADFSPEECRDFERAAPRRRSARSLKRTRR